MLRIGIAGARVVGVRGLDKAGSVLDLGIVEMGEGIFADFPGFNLARCSSADWPGV